MRLTWCVIVITLAISRVTEASAQNARLVTAQPEHELLERLAGEWEYERLSVPAEGSEPEVLGSGSISAEMVGAFFVVSRWSGSKYGFDHEALQTLGYDSDRSTTPASGSIRS